IVASRLREHGDIIVNEFMLRAGIRDHENNYEITLFPDGRAIVKGTNKPEIARSIYAKFVGN
ncbi:MAG: thiazole biosynthesis adenylyltransferase ThiF, partial [Gammaproteobacteria bacterium]|nr:thiazole biosynthesis adenylyltransferase ThiF [Gammaproteobacteria bacterium]